MDEIIFFQFDPSTDKSYIKTYTHLLSSSLSRQIYVSGVVPRSPRDALK